MKLGPVTTAKPVRVNIRLPIDLKARLDLYTARHHAVFKESVDVTILIPFMLKAFLDSDPEFRKAEKESFG